jgi:hypothetical protein
LKIEPIGCPETSVLSCHSTLRNIPEEVKVKFSLEQKEGRREMTERRGRRRKQLLDDLKEKRRYWKLKEEALDRHQWRTRFGRGYGPVVRQTTE